MTCFGAGNEFGVYGGISPAINRDPLLVEAYYKLNVNEYFSLTPAVIYADKRLWFLTRMTNVYGALRATFQILEFEQT